MFGGIPWTGFVLSLASYLPVLFSSEHASPMQMLGMWEGRTGGEESPALADHDWVEEDYI